MQASKLKSELSQFIGTEGYHQVYPQVLLTDGVKFLCEEAGSYWLMDLIWSVYPKLRKDWFHCLTLTVDLKKSKGEVVITDGDKGDGEVVVYRQKIGYTDFPLEKQMLFISSLDGGLNADPRLVVMLPSEY